MRWNTLAVIASLVYSQTFAGDTQAAEQHVGQWTLVTDNSDRLVSMAYPNPPAGLGIVQMLELDMGANATVTKGRLTFKNGVKRAMTKEEVAYYYALLDGPNTAWDYLAAKNQVSKYSPSTTPLPTNLAGSKARVIIQKGTSFFGTLSFEATRPGGFFLSVDGASRGPIRFENGIVREVQVSK